MLLLLLFALVAGAGTAITPCVLPVLPALLSASAVGGRRRPLGIVLGLALTFTITIVLLAQLVNGVGLGSSATRILAFIVLIGFGLIMLVPALAQRVQAPLSRLARFGPKTRGDGFWTGLGVGAALGFVCAPCAGPILAAVIAASASRGPSVRAATVGIAYAIGLSAVLLLYAFGGRAVLESDQADCTRRCRRARAWRRADRHRHRDRVQPRRPLREPARTEHRQGAWVPAGSDRLTRELVGGAQAAGGAAARIQVRQAPSGG